MNQVPVRRRIDCFLQERKNDLVYLLARLGLAIARMIPPAVGLRLGGFLGELAYYILPRERRRVRAHLAIAFGDERTEEEKRRIARGCFRNLGMNLIEMVTLSRSRSDLGRFVAIEGRHHLDEALATGRGVLVITAHLGNWELMAFYMARHGYQLNVVAREVYDPRLNRILLAFREREGIRVILRDSAGAGRQLLQALKRGEILAMLIDQDTKVKGVMADFFGRKANTPAGPAILARRRSIPVLPMFIHRVSGRQHQILVCPPVEIDRSEDLEGDILRNTERFNRSIELHIREHPEQWVWNHRRWRRQSAYQPVGEQRGLGSLSL